MEHNEDLAAPEVREVPVFDDGVDEQLLEQFWRQVVENSLVRVNRFEHGFRGVVVVHEDHLVQIGVGGVESVETRDD